MKLLKIGSNPQNDIVYNSNKVSGMHAEIILLNNGDILLEDKNSLNGTYVMNQRIKPATAVTIRRGDAVRFADTELQWNQVPYPEDNSMYSKVLGIGSNFRNEIQVTGNTVSRFHATLKVDKQGKAYIEDHSMNGTTVNGQRIASHQNVRVKPSDAVAVGGVPINLKNYISADTKSIMLKVLGGLLAVAAVVAIVLLLRKPDTGKPSTQQPVAIATDTTRQQIAPANKVSNNPSIDALWDATVFVYGAFKVDLTIKNDPFKGRQGWPQVWTFGFNQNGAWELFGENACWYSGTAFFVSPYGEMATNRHVAYPWLAGVVDDVSVVTEIKAQMIAVFNRLLNNDFFQSNLGIDYNNEGDRAKMQLLLQSDFEVSGHHEFLGVLLPHQNFSSTNDFMSCKPVAESGDPKKDVALLRLNSQQTPPSIVRNGYYRLETARADQSTIGLNEPLTSIGYPTGQFLSTFIGNSNESTPTYTNLTVSKRPDEYQFQAQGLSIGGASGSPVLDKDRNLVGVLWGRAGASDQVVFICNIKHFIEIYEKHKVTK
jgi:pSer/pThr/pTyr-binding forkhead associated (FHA) protein